MLFMLTHQLQGPQTPCRWNFLPSLCVALYSHSQNRNVFAMLSSNFDFFLPAEMKMYLKQSEFPFLPPEAASVPGQRQVCVLLLGDETAGPGPAPAPLQGDGPPVGLSLAVPCGNARDAHA